jgi:hypothetical protein
MKQTLWLLLVLALPLAGAWAEASPEKAGTAPEPAACAGGTLDMLFGAQPAAEGDLGSCRPLISGWTCTSSSYCDTSHHCAVIGGPSGHPKVTTCTCCPPPCTNPPCELQICETRTSFTCGC